MTTYLTHTGHLCMPDGSVLRLDAELGRYVASWYAADLTLPPRERRGSFEDMRNQVNSWAAEVETRCRCTTRTAA